MLAVETNGAVGDPAVGMLLIAGLAAVAFVVGRVTRRWLSEVVVFIAIGIIIGPEVTGLIDARRLEQLDPVIAIALGAIVFGIGEHLELPALRRLRHTLTPIAILENAATFGLVFLALVLARVDTATAYLLAAIALSTSPTTLVAVINERRARGPLTDHLQAATALNNVTSALLYGVGLPVVLATRTPSGLGEGVFAFAQLVVASVVIGGVGAFVLRRWADAVRGVGERLLFVLVVLLGIVAVSMAVGAPVVVSTLVAGALLANDPRDTRPLFGALKTLEAPIFLVFFVVAGAGVHFTELAAIGGVGAAYVAGRLVGKVAGAWAGAHLTRSGRRAGWGAQAGMGLLPFAGMAIGLAAFTLEKATAAGATDLGVQVTAVVLGSVVVFELLGPLAVRHALDTTGESGRAAGEEEAEAVAAQQAPHRIHHILFPVSSPEMARQKGPVVVDLALSSGASLTVLHVVSSEQDEDAADPALSVVRQLAQARGVDVELVRRAHDDVVDCIVEEAHRGAVDLVVLGEPAPRRLVPPSRRIIAEVTERLGPGVRVLVVPTTAPRDVAAEVG